MKNNLKWIVYCTTNTINNKIYIGVHKTDYTKFDGYLGCGVWIQKPSTYEHPKTYLLHAIKKYGVKKFKRITLSVYDTENEAYNVEAALVNLLYISHINTYNMVLGGDCSPKLKISVYKYYNNGIFAGEYNSYLDAADELLVLNSTIRQAVVQKFKVKGFYFSDKKLPTIIIDSSDKRAIPIYLYNINGNYEGSYESIREASKVLSIHSANISRAIKLGISTNNKYFSLVHTDLYSVAIERQRNSSPVYQYDINGEFIEEYHNLLDALNKLHITSSIYKAIKLNLLCCGYQWRFEKFDRINSIVATKGRVRKVAKYTINNVLVKEYNSVAEALRENGRALLHVLSGRDRTYKGYIYKYLN